MFLVWSLFSPGDFPWYLFTTIFVDQVWVKGTVQMQCTLMGWLQLAFHAFHNENKRQIFFSYVMPVSFLLV